jgi:hypothetical protein
VEVRLAPHLFDRIVARFVAVDMVALAVVDQRWRLLVHSRGEQRVEDLASEVAVQLLAQWAGLLPPCWP